MWQNLVKIFPTVTETGTLRTLTADDAFSHIRCTNVVQGTIVVPQNTLADADVVQFEQAGLGTLMFVPSGSLVLNCPTGCIPSSNGQYAFVGIRFSDANVATLYGNIVAV